MISAGNSFWCSAGKSISSRHSLPVLGPEAKGRKAIKTTVVAKATEKPLEQGPEEANEAPLAQALHLQPA